MAIVKEQSPQIIADNGIKSVEVVSRFFCKLYFNRLVAGSQPAMISDWF